MGSIPIPAPMEVITLRKKLFLIASAFICVSSLVITSFSISPDSSLLNDTYSVMQDVMPLVALDPANPPWDGNTTTFRFVQGVLYSGNNIVDGKLADVLAYEGVASKQYVDSIALTVPNIVSAFQQYFSDNTTFESDNTSGLSFAKLMSKFWSSDNYSWSLPRVPLSTNNRDTINFQNFPAIMNSLMNYLLFDLNVPIGAQRMNYTGAAVPVTANMPLSEALNAGFMGLGYLLGGASNPNGHSYFVDVNNNLKTLSNLLYSNGLVPSDLYLVGGVGEDPGVPRSNIALYLGDYLGEINRSLITQHGYLGSDGLDSLNSSMLNLALSDVTADGFVGLARILRGQSDALPLTYKTLDYTDLSESSYAIDDLLSAILYPSQDIQNLLATYLYSHGTDLDIDIRHNMQDQAEQFVEDFTSSSGKGTATSSQMGDMANVSGGIKDGFQSTSSVADAFTQINNADNYSFFSSDVQTELNPMYHTRSILDDGFIDLLTPRLEEFDKVVGSSW